MPSVDCCTVGVEDLLAVKNACGAHEVAANRAIQLIRRLLNWSAGRVDGKVTFWPIQNLAKEVSTYDEKKRERKQFLQGNLLDRFNEALKQETHEDLKLFLLLAITTGARRGNILEMRWQDVQWERQVWEIPKTKNGESYNVQLLDTALEALRRRRATALKDTVYVFPGPGKTGHLTDIKKPWQEFRKRAQLKDFRIHDIRHTHASWMAIAGVPLPQIGAALGHRSLTSTMRYSHLVDEAVREGRERGQIKMLEAVRASQKEQKKLLGMAVGRG